MPKVLLFANSDWYLYNYRLSLADRLRDDGWEVVLVSPGGKYGPKFPALGHRWVEFDFSTRGTNPLKEMVVLGRLIRLYRRERPHVAHHFTTKCIVYGSLAARALGNVAVINAVTGLGWAFNDPSRKGRWAKTIVKLLYRYVMSAGNVRVIFQNCNDRDRLVEGGVVAEHRTHVIRGSGIDCNRFRPTESQDGLRDDGKVRILFASRLLRDKGVYELLEAAAILKRRGLAAQVLVAGDAWPENPASLAREEIDDIARSGLVEYLGHVEDMPALIRRCDIVVLPSYFEGTPRVLMEAAATARPVVATAIPGCEGLVQHGVNGLLVPVKDSRALADALERLIRDAELRRELGQQGRRIVLETFENQAVLRKTLAVYP